MTTHYMEEAERLCEDLLIIDQGRIIAQGSPQNLINRYFKRRAIDFLDPGLSEREVDSLIGSLDGRVEHEEDEGRFIIYSENTSETFARLMEFFKERGMNIDDIVIRRASLEDVFLKLTGRGISE